MSSEYEKPDDREETHRGMKKHTKQGELIGKKETKVKFEKRISYDYSPNTPLDEAVTLMVEGHNLNCAIQSLPEIEAGYLVIVSVYRNFEGEHRPNGCKYSLLDKFVFDGEKAVNMAHGQSPEVARAGDFALYPKNNYDEFAKGVPKVQLQIAAYWPGNLEAPAHEIRGGSRDSARLFIDDAVLQESEQTLGNAFEKERRKKTLEEVQKDFPFNKAE